MEPIRYRTRSACLEIGTGDKSLILKVMSKNFDSITINIDPCFLYDFIVDYMQELYGNRIDDAVLARCAQEANHIKLLRLKYQENSDG